MPAHDVQYVLDSSLDCCHIGADTHFYLMEMEPNANRIVDEQPPAQNEDWGYGLRQMGLYFENHYVNWRAQHRADAISASYMGLLYIPRVFNELTRTIASSMADAGFESYSNDAIAHVNKKFGMETSKAIMKRTLCRASEDFAGWNKKDILGMETIVQGRRDNNAIEYNAMVKRIMSTMRNQIDDTMVWLDDYSTKARFDPASEEQRAKKLAQEIPIEGLRRIIDGSGLISRYNESLSGVLDTIQTLDLENASPDIVQMALKLTYG